MTVRPVPLVDHSAPQLSGATAEVVTVSALLSMPAVWTSVVDRALPVDVLLERFMILLLSCALLAELIRRLGEGGALSRAMAEAAPATDPVPTTARNHAASAHAPAPASDLFETADTAVLDPLPLEAPLTDDLGDLGDLGDLAPLDLDADPFANPA